MKTLYITKVLHHSCIMTALVILTGCAAFHPFIETRTEYREVPVAVEITNTETPPGVVQYVWEEPMVDVVDVPPGLDPEGHYYRPAHQSVVEVRQGRWRHFKSENN